MVNESKNMYIPEDTLENHQGTWWLFQLISENIFQLCMRGGRGWREGGSGVGGGDLKMGVGEDVWEGRWRGVSSPRFQQFDRCSTFTSTYPPSAAWCVPPPPPPPPMIQYILLECIYVQLNCAVGGV